MRRLAIVRLGGPDDGIRRYRLARLDEVALASPPDKTTPPEPAGDAADPVAEPGGDDPDQRSNRAA